MHTDTIEGDKGVIGAAERAIANSEASAANAAVHAKAAKERVERIERGETVKGGLGKPLTTLAPIGFEDGDHLSLWDFARRPVEQVRNCSARAGNDRFCSQLCRSCRKPVGPQRDLARSPSRRRLAGVCAQRPSAATSLDKETPQSRSVPTRFEFGTASRLILSVWRPGPVGAFVTIYTRTASLCRADSGFTGVAREGPEFGRRRSFAANTVRLQLHALVYNLGNFLRKRWRPPAKVASHGHYVAFQMAEVAIPRNFFAEILRLNIRAGPPSCVDSVSPSYVPRSLKLPGEVRLMTENSALLDDASGANPIERHRLLAATALACRCRWNDAVFLSNWRPSGMSVELCFGAASSMFAPKTVGGDRS